MSTPARGRRTGLGAVLSVTVLVLGGCGGEDAGADAGAGAGADGVVEIEVEIADGEVTPRGERFDVTVGQRIRLEVDSDMRDELHLHADPERTFEVAVGEDQVFEFTLEQPRVAELESHELDVVVATLAARP